MSGKPIITFRISTYQLARGLQIIRQLEPEYKLTSLNKMIKVLYIDYLTKMSIGKSDSVPQHFIDEIESMLYKPTAKNKTFEEFNQAIKVSSENEKSIKTSVEDFSPPKDWLE